MPRARSRVQMLLAWGRAICVELTVGIRSSLVGPPLAAGRPANAVTVRTLAAHATRARAVCVLMALSPLRRGMVPSLATMRLLRRALILLAMLAIVAYVGAVIWLVVHETNIVFAAGPPVRDPRPRPPC